MSSLTVEKIVARTRQFDIESVKRLNCWGCELADVSILRKMPAVEVLALTMNKISSLIDLEECKNLQELYLRKNNISDLLELRYLQNLPKLKKLSLDENPCHNISGYRMIVLRALPKLQELDNVPVTPEEVQLAQQAPTQDGDMYSKVPIEDDEQEDAKYYEGKFANDEYGDKARQHGDNLKSSYQCKYPGSPVARGIVPELDLDTSVPSKSDKSPRYESDIHHSPRVKTVNQDNATHHQRKSSSPFKPIVGSQIPVYVGTIRDSNAHETSPHGGGLHRRKLSKNTNILSACLCLVDELDYNSLDRLQLRVRARMEEIFDLQEH